ncbi:hypothetical protein DL96DRAFT_1685619 [Flagelloscypha sp. PMI_526]|nr:hypothetical protein DL96DRAFT_1685619 [Flagelloscypha sp. PMI_526]
MRRSSMIFQSYCSSQNVVTINGLPNGMGRPSLRGKTFIQKKVSRDVPAQYTLYTTPLFTELQCKEPRRDVALAHLKSTVQSLERYMESTTADKTPMDTAIESSPGSRNQSGSVDEQIINLADKLGEINVTMSTRKTVMSRPQDNMEVRVKTTVQLLSAEQTEPDIVNLWSLPHDGFTRPWTLHGSHLIVYNFEVSFDDGKTRWTR